MHIETLRLTHDECEGYALKIDGELVFEYFTEYYAREDSTLDRDHKDVLALGGLIYRTYRAGVDTRGQGEVTLKKCETKNREEYDNFAFGDNECTS